MDSVGVAVWWAVEAAAVALFLWGAVAFAVLVRGCFELRRRARGGTRDYGDVLLKSPLVPAVSTIAVPPDASPESLQFARRLLNLHFGSNEVVVVLDGPSAAALETWIREFRLCASARGVERDLSTARVRGVYESRDPIRIVVVDKEPGGQADAWNAGVNVAASPVIGLLDPESEFESVVLLRLIQPMLEAPEETLAVCGGGVLAPAGGMAARWGALECLRAWLTRGAAFAGRRRVLPFPGAALLAQRSAVVSAGGFSGGPLELILRLHAFGKASQEPYRIAFLPEPVSFRRLPATFAGLRRQVSQDQRQLARAFRQRKSLAGPFAGELLSGLYWDRKVRPMLELAAYALTAAGLLAGWVDAPLAGLVLLSTVGMGMLLSMAAVVLRELAQPARSDPQRVNAMFWAAIPENLGYRQLRALWLIGGLRNAAARRK